MALLVASKEVMTEDAKVVLGRRLRELRRERGLTQEQLARAAKEMSRVYLGALERGERSAGLETIQRLARGLEVEVVDLLRDVPTGGPKARPRKLTPAQRLARVVEALAEGVDAKTIRRFERLAKSFFLTK